METFWAIVAGLVVLIGLTVGAVAVLFAAGALLRMEFIRSRRKKSRTGIYVVREGEYDLIIPCTPEAREVVRRNVESVRGKIPLYFGACQVPSDKFWMVYEKCQKDPRSPQLITVETEKRSPLKGVAIVEVDM